MGYEIGYKVNAYHQEIGKRNHSISHVLKW